MTRKPWALIIIAAVLLAILSLRLFKLQVLNWRIYLEESEDKRIKREVIEAPRGYITDRNGVILAENRLSYSITIDPFERDRFGESVPQLASFLGVTTDDLDQKVRELTAKSRNPVKIVRDADFRLFSIVMEHNHELPGVDCILDQRRNYPQGRLASHVIGYMGESPEELKKLREKGYFYGQQIGVYGIEKFFEQQLKGKNGAKFVERNYMTRIMDVAEEYKPDPPVSGKDVTLTLDVRLQIAAEEAFGDSIRGSLVAIDPRNGEILVMASLPSFDPNEFAGVMQASHLQQLWNDPAKPMFNRGIQATYPPGSSFKMLTALAGLENGFTEQSTFSPCTGSYYFGRKYDCWKEGGHGKLNMINAIINSCNVYYYQLGRRVGIEKWSSTADLLGLGHRTGIDIEGEETGVIPSLTYYEKMGVAYSPGMMLNLAIGQGEIIMTVLQLARYVGILATEGMLTRPHLSIDRYEPPSQVIGISKHSFQVVKEGMKGVVHDPSGTAKGARIPGHFIAGKTGTAQNPHGADHKIFLAFAPYDDPAIAIACVAENAGDYTPSRAVIIVKRVLEEYFAYYPDNTVNDDK